jgi:SAM-dependent methyltransferase
MAGSYETLAADYDWMFDDDALANGAAIRQPATARLLQKLDPTSTLLDAACGTGVDAVVLARRGFKVWAADGSDAMADAAAARFRQERVAIPLLRSQWADLPTATAERFDVVLCVGNSLVHAQGRQAMVDALMGLRRILRPDGHMVIDSRNWEKLHAERLVQVADRVVTRRGQSCFVLYAWEIPDRFDEDHIAHVVFVFQSGDRIEAHDHAVSFRPFTLSDLRQRLDDGGLKEVDTDFDDSADRYAVVARLTPDDRY